eukprot:c23809_g1_i2 orf=3-2129(-)
MRVSCVAMAALSVPPTQHLHTPHLGPIPSLKHLLPPHSISHLPQTVDRCSNLHPPRFGPPCHWRGGLNVVCVQDVDGLQKQWVFLGLLEKNEVASRDNVFWKNECRTNREKEQLLSCSGEGMQPVEQRLDLVEPLLPPVKTDCDEGLWVRENLAGACELGKVQEMIGNDRLETWSGEGTKQAILSIANNLPTNSMLGEFLDSFSEQVDTSCGNEILRSLGDQRLFCQALSFFEWMRIHTPCLLDSKTFCTIFSVLGRAGMVDRALTLFRNMPNESKFHCVNAYNALISALANNGRNKDALLVLEEMATRGVRQDSVTASILITSAWKNNHNATDAWRIFALMDEKRIQPSITVFGSLIKAFCEEGLRKEALVIAREAERRGLTINTVIYNTLIDAHGKEDLLEEAEGLFSEMQNRGVCPSVSTYNSLISAYGRQGKWESAEALLAEMQASGVIPDVVSYSALISAYGKQKLSEKAANAFLRMKKNGICPNAYSYTALIHAYSEGGWHEKATISFENMVREGLLPTTETYTALLDGYRQAGELEKLKHVWKMMRKEKCVGSRITFNVLVDAFAKQGCYKDARDVIFEFAKLGYKPDRLTYNMLINAYARGGRHVKIPEILKEMSAAGFEPDPFTYTTIIYAFLRVRDFKKAFLFHNRMCKYNQQPDKETYMKLKTILDTKYAMKVERDQKSVFGQAQKQNGILKEGERVK